MLKNIGIVLLVFILGIVFIEPLRNYMNSLVHKDRGESKEEQVIGTVSGYNPRVRESQKILKHAGFEPGSVDGMMGTQTRKAIREFQKKEGLRPTGKIDSKTQSALDRERERQLTKPELAIGSLLAKTAPAEPKIENLDIEVGKTKDEIKPQSEIPVRPLKPIGKAKQIQTALKKAGFYKGKIDGKIGPQTKKAIKAFQKEEGLKPNGVVDSRTWAELNIYLEN